VNEDSYNRILCQRLAIIHARERLDRLAMIHCDSLVELVGEGKINRGEAIDHLNDIPPMCRSAADGMVMRAGARLPMEGTGVMPY